MTTDNEIKQCPACGEDIKAIAKKCKHCGEMQEQPKQPDPEFKTCSSCGEDIKFVANKCKHCGDSQGSCSTKNTNNPTKEKGKRKPNLPVASLIMGVLAIVRAITWNGRGDGAIVILTFALIGLITGIIALVKKKPGKGKAIAGIILSLLAFLR